MRAGPAIGVDPIWLPRLGRMSRWLLVYGVAGIAVAAFAILALLVGLARVNGLADRLRDDVGGVSSTLERTADVLERASTTAHGFGTTIDGTTTALQTVGTDIRDIVPRLDAIGGQAGAINILGSQPLAPIAGLLTEISHQLGDVQGQLDTVAADLAGNRTSLETTATALADLGTETRALADRLGGDALPGALDDARWLFVALLGIAALGAGVPAFGALAAGIWIRRELGLT